MTKAVEDAVRESGMGLNPSSEGQGQVNVPIPKPTKESREAVAKVAAKHAEKVNTIMVDWLVLFFIFIFFVFRVCRGRFVLALKGDTDA